MKKFKKLLTVLGLGVALSTTALFAGCTIGEDQQASIDKLVNNTDSLTTAIESYLNNQASKDENALSSEEAIGLLNTAYKKLSLLQENKMNIKGSLKTYNGLAEEFIEDRQISLDFEKSTESCVIWVNSEAIIPFDESAEAEISNILLKSDFKNDIHYTVRGEETLVVEEREYDSKDFISFYESKAAGISGALMMVAIENLYAENIGSLSSKNIKSVKKLDSGYEISIERGFGMGMMDDAGVRNIVASVIIDFEGRITNFECSMIEFFGTTDDFYYKDESSSFPLVGEDFMPVLQGSFSDLDYITTYKCSYTFSYDENVDFTKLNNFVAECDEKYALI